jgi:putative tryptophan/tyrosine transport system substrate-binding protein
MEGIPINQSYWQETQKAARPLGLEARLFQVEELADLPTAFGAIAQDGTDGVVVLSDAQFNSARRTIIALAAKYRLAVMYEAREFVQDGGFISYGPNIVEMTRRSAAFVDKILKGAMPADLPLEQPTTFELVINLKTATALGLDVPPTLLVRADEVVE